MRTALLILSYFLLVTSHAQSVSWTWGRQVGGSTYAGGSNTSVDAFGNTLQVGTFRNTISFGTVTLTSLGTMAMYLLKYDSQGRLVWAKQAGDAPAPGSSIGAASGLSLTTDATGNIYVIGGFNGSVTFGSTTLTAAGTAISSPANSFVCKYNSNGNPLWAVLEGGPQQTDGLDIAVDNASGSVFVSGSYTNSATFGSVTLTSQGGEDIFLAKYTSQGSLAWVRSAGGTSQDNAYSLAVDAQSNVYITGVVTNSAAFGPITTLGYGNSDAFVAKFDAQGVAQWVQLYGGAGYDEGTQVTLDGTGGFYLTGNFAQNAAFSAFTLTSLGVNDGFLVRGNAQGQALWAKQLSGSGYDTFLNVRLGNNGGVYLLGSFSSPIVSYNSYPFVTTGGSDLLLMRCDSNGNFVWGQSGGGAGNDLGGGLSCGANGIVSFGCTFATSTQFGPFAFTSTGNATNAALFQVQDNTVTSAHSGVKQVSISAYPNPASSSSLLTLTLPSAASSRATVELINTVGQVVKKVETSPDVNGRITISLADCALGAYTIRYKSAREIATMKLSLL